MNSNDYTLKFKPGTVNNKLGSIYFEKKEKKEYWWCLHKDCIYTSKEYFDNKLDLLEHCRKCH